VRFATLYLDGSREQAAVSVHGDSWAPLDRVDPELAGDLLVLIGRSPTPAQLEEIGLAAEKIPASGLVAASTADYRPPYRRPRKIWGIGLNYADHAADLGAAHPTQPASFIKGDHTIIGPGDSIQIPRQSERVTAEAELGLIIGTETRDVGADAAMDYVFGVCAILDQTAEDILLENPRYLTRSKNFPTFFSFGPEVVTLDEFLGTGRLLGDITVTTLLNGAEVRSNRISNMAHPPDRLIEFHSAMMPLFPGDIISTGTPGAAAVQDGDIAEARVEGLLPLVNPVGPSTRKGSTP
jgi:2-keto-4-pentenoate hydratase/2-oxohepta-3-ene-1,7-dioic acid hydratase in catechol pathway